MNKGVIYKIATCEEKVDGKDSVIKKYFIYFDDNKKLNEKVYNLYFDGNKEYKEVTIEQDVTLLSIEKDFTSDIDLSAYLGKKLEFVLDITNSKITSIEETAINNEK